MEEESDEGYKKMVSPSRMLADRCYYCQSASYFTCSNCESLLCKRCPSNQQIVHVSKEEKCRCCGASNADCCRQCFSNGFRIELITCKGDENCWGCWKKRCSSCLINSFQDGVRECRACYEIGFDALVKEENAAKRSMSRWPKLTTTRKRSSS